MSETPWLDRLRRHEAERKSKKALGSAHSKSSKLHPGNASGSQATNFEDFESTPTGHFSETHIQPETGGAMNTLPLFIVRPAERRPTDKRDAPYWTLIGPGVKAHRYKDQEYAWGEAIKMLRQDGAAIAVLYAEDGKTVEWLVRRHVWPPEESWRRPEDWIPHPREQQRRARRETVSTGGFAA
jgi:hypothetical protein